MDKIIDKDKYNDSIIIISGEIESNIEIEKCEMIHSIAYKNIGIEEILKNINKLLENKEFIKADNLYKKRIENEILYLGYNISHKGTQYLIKVIEYIASNPNKELNYLEKDVYSKVATIYNDSEHNVKCKINCATTEM